MNGYILQINYTRDWSRESGETDFKKVAEAIASVPGLLWKIWLFDNSTCEGGGIYLFSDRAALNAFLDGPIIHTLKTEPGFRGLNVKSYGILEAMSKVTRAPV